MRILIVEDEPFIAFDLEGLLTDAGHEVVGVADCRSDALALAAGAQAALVDLNLRDGLTGPDIALQLLERGLRVVVVSGNIELIGPKLRGRAAIVAKPYAPAAVLAALG